MGNAVKQAVAASPPVPVAQPDATAAVPQRNTVGAALPDGVARYGDSTGAQIYMGKGAHGEPVFSDTVRGAQNINPRTGAQYTGDGSVPSSIPLDPADHARAAVGALRSGGAQLFGRMPTNEPQPASNAGPDQTAQTDASIARLRGAPNGGNEFARNTVGMNAEQALYMNPAQRQDAVLRSIAANQDPNLDAETRSSNAALIRQLGVPAVQGNGQPGQPGQFGQPGQPGGLTQAQAVTLGLKSNAEANKQTNVDAERRIAQEKEGQGRANDTFNSYYGALKDNTALDEPSRRRIASVQSLPELAARDPNYLDSEAGRAAVGNLYDYANKALHPRGIAPGGPGVNNLHPGDPVDIEEQNGLGAWLRGSKYSMSGPYARPDPAHPGTMIAANANDPGASRNTYQGSSLFGPNILDGRQSNITPELATVLGKNNENLGRYAPIFQELARRQKQQRIKSSGSQ